MRTGALDFSELLADIQPPELECPDLSQTSNPRFPVPNSLFAERKRAAWKDVQTDEARCDFAPDRMRLTNRGGVFFITLWKKSVYGRTLTDIKADDAMVGYFADSIAPLIRSVLGSFLSPDDFAVVTTPKRRHGNRASRTQSRACSSYAEAQPIEGVANERNFASMISGRIAELLGLPFFEDCALAHSKHRVGAVFSANNIPPQRNIIVFDDFVTTGQTLVSMQNLLKAHGKNCVFFAGINNKL